MSVAAVIASLKVLGDTVSAIPSAAKNYIELHQQVMELVQENHDLSDQIAVIKKRLQIRGMLQLKDRQYYLKRRGKRTDGPFCTRCWDVDAKLVRMHDGVTALGPVMSCPECDTEIYVTNRPRKARPH